MRFTTIRVSFVGAVLFSVIAVAQPRRMELDDLGRIVRVTDPQIAPDGKSIVVVMSRANYEENRYDADLVIVDVASGSPRTLTQDRRGISQPRFSPSGDRLAFLSSVVPSAGQPARAQIFVMPMGGGDTRRITSAPKGVQHFAWSPDGRTIAYATEDEAEKKTGPERFNDSFEVENDDIFIQSQRLPTHVWSVPADGGEAKRLHVGVVEPADLVSAGRAGIAAELDARWRVDRAGPPWLRRTRATPTAPRSRSSTWLDRTAARPDGTRAARGPADVLARWPSSPTGSRVTATRAARIRSTSPRRRRPSPNITRAPIGTPPVRSGCRTGSRFSSAPTTRPRDPVGPSARRRGAQARIGLREPGVLVLGGCSRSAGTARSPSPPRSGAAGRVFTTWRRQPRRRNG